MSGPTTSLVKISAAKVEAAAKDMLGRVKKWQAEEREEEIERYMNSWKWFRKVFNKPVSRIEAEKFVDKEHSWDSDYGLWRIRGWGVESNATDFLNAAQNSADGFVWLNLEDASFINKFK